jgi:cytochrome c oxidase subunit 7c
MLARATFRAASAPTLVARRGFQSTRAQMSSPYHYPEGPRSNLPFDPLKRGFAFKYWGFMGELGQCYEGMALANTRSYRILSPIPPCW